MWYQYDFKTNDGNIIKSEIVKGRYKKYVLQNICRRLTAEHGKTITYIETTA